MPLEIAHKTIRFFVANAPPNASLTFLWHSGEPTSVGSAYFEDMIQAETDRADVCIRHKVQTNATLITEKWCELFRRNQIDVGVSLDGPRHVHDKYRVRRSGKGSFDETVRGIKLLQAHDVRVSNLAVITDYSLEYPEQIYDFFRACGLDVVGYSVEQIEGTHGTSKLFSQIQTDSTERYQSFLSHLYARWKEDNFVPLIREFDWVIKQVLFLLSDSRRNVGSDQVKPLKIVAVSSEGDVVTFSPELITGSVKDRTRFVIGNIRELTNFGDLVSSSTLDGLAQEVNAGVDKCKKECQHFAICGGGSVSSKYFENGSVNSTETAYCRAHKKLMFDCISRLLTDDDIDAYLKRRRSMESDFRAGIAARGAGPRNRATAI